jgi:hypothetical protein
LEAFEEPCLEDSDRWARNVIEHLKREPVAIRRQLLGLAAQLEQTHFVYVLQECIEQKILTRGDLINLYQHQTLHVRAFKPYLHLHDLKKMSRGGKLLFSEEEIVQLAAQNGSVSVHDVELFMKNPEKLPADLVWKWVDASGSDDGLSVLTKAKIAKYLYEKHPKSLDRETLMGHLKYSAAADPNSGAVQIFITILYELEGKRKRARRDSAREAFVSAIVRMITPTTERTSMAFFSAQKLLGWYLSNPYIKKEDRDWVESEIVRYTETYAEMYRNFIRHAKEKSAFSVH